MNNNKELKFRIWNRNAKCFVGGPNNRVAIFDLMTFAYYCSLNRIENLDDFVIQQFIGFKDRNGNLIYEGDFVTVDDIKEPYKIEFRGIGFWFIGENDDCWVFSDRVYKLEVIRNVFEDPELIK